MEFKEQDPIYQLGEDGLVTEIIGNKTLVELVERVKKLTEQVEKLIAKETEKPKSLTVNDLVEGSWYWDTWLKKRLQFKGFNEYDDHAPLRFFDGYETHRYDLGQVQDDIVPYDAELERAAQKLKRAEEEKKRDTTPTKINKVCELKSHVVYTIGYKTQDNYDKVFFQRLDADWAIFTDVETGTEYKVCIELGFNAVLDPYMEIFVYPYKQVGYKSETGWENET